MDWNTHDIPNLSEKFAIVTGGSRGIGYHISLELARVGAKVIIAARNVGVGEEAVRKIRDTLPQADVSFGQLDLGDLTSVKNFARNFNEKNVGLDILVNNAAILPPTPDLVTIDGLEIVIGTNHLGPFALTGELLPSLRRAKDGARVVNVTSALCHSGYIDFEGWEGPPNRWLGQLRLYSNSKLAQVMFTMELQKRSDTQGLGITAVSAHPGLVNTDMTDGNTGNLVTKFLQFLKPFFAQEPAEGALPILLAANSENVVKGGFYGPTGFWEMNGKVGIVKPPDVVNDQELCEKVWQVSEKLTGTKWQ